MDTLYFYFGGSLQCCENSVFCGLVQQIVQDAVQKLPLLYFQRKSASFDFKMH